MANASETPWNPITGKGCLQQVWQVYQITAVMMLNTLLLLGLALIVVQLLLPQDLPIAQKSELTPQEMRPIGINVVYSERFNRTAYYATSAREVDQLLSEMDQWAAAGHWQVHPWASLTSRPFQGQFLTIGTNGERGGVAPSPDHEGQPPLIIWFFGGSTSFGWGLPDRFTPPSQLQLELQKLIPNRQIQVTNFAVPIYASSQELALFISNLRWQKQKPDIAIFLDGLNDTWFPMYANNPVPLTDPLAGAWEASLIRALKPANQPWLTLNASFPPLRLARQMNIDVSQLALQPQYDLQYAMRGTGASTPEESLAFIIRQYRTNRTMAKLIGDGFGVETFFFLQPWTDPYYTAFRENLITDNDVDNFYDVTNVFATANPNYLLFVDDIHYSEYGSNLLAQAMANTIAGKLGQE